MNYRHHYHAGNFADVAKHAMLVQLVLGLQRKEKGFVYIDTHAGRGSYDLAQAARGDTLARKPEHPDGIGRLLANADQPAAAEGDPIAKYLEIVRLFDDRLSGGSDGPLRHYPGSPWIVHALMRLQDRMALCEMQPEESRALAAEFDQMPRVSVHAMDGYGAVRAMLPPLEKRALVLIDPPFEAQDEYAKVIEALREGLRRMPAATYAVWYPLTERARADEFLDRLAMLAPPPTFAAELMIAGESSSIKMKGCGLAVINPPWQIDSVIAPMLATLAKQLAQAPGAGSRLQWIVRE